MARARPASLLLRDGRIVHRGRHGEILAEADGPYARLVAAQNARAVG